MDERTLGRLEALVEGVRQDIGRLDRRIADHTETEERVMAAINTRMDAFATYDDVEALSRRLAAHEDAMKALYVTKESISMMQKLVYALIVGILGVVGAFVWDVIVSASRMIPPGAK